MSATVGVEVWGPDAFLLRRETAGDGDAHGRWPAIEIETALEASGLPGLLEMTPGYETMLVEFEAGRRPPVECLRAVLAAVPDDSGTAGPGGRMVELPVVYDGADLERVARGAGMGVDEVIARHSGAVYRVRLLGFAPGFAYLDGLDPRLRTPRLETPRPRVPAGSVAIGGGHAGVYPAATAGGWNLLGRTTVALLDLGLAREGRVEAFVLRPGDEVRFVPIEAGEGNRA